MSALPSPSTLQPHPTGPPSDPCTPLWAVYGGTIFPSLQQFDADVVSIVLRLLNAPEGAGGSLTTGGTESILLAVKTAVHWAREAKPHLEQLEIIVPYSCHPGFEKAADMLGGVRVVRLPESDADYAADIPAMRAAVSPATVMLVGSAPSYPYGIVDDITAMSALAIEHDLWLHVDACNGGMIFPFSQQLGRAVREYDFALDGVRSVSVDIHKLGYSNKGVSSLLLRNAEEERFHRFTFSDWPSGLYSTASIAGSRSGGGVASAWAVMHYLGAAGYREIVGEIFAAVDAFVAGIEAISPLRVLGRPDAYLVAFESADEAVDILAVDAGMTERGWSGTQCVKPLAIHLFIDGSHSPAVAEEYCADLAEVVEMARRGEIVAPTTTHNVLGVYTRD